MENVEMEREAADVESIRLNALEDLQFLTAIGSQNPELADAVTDPLRFQQVWQNTQRHVALHNADPVSEESQKKIEEMIREEQAMKSVEREQAADVENIRQQALRAPQVLASIRSQNPELANAVTDPLRFQQVRQNLLRRVWETDEEKQRELELLNADPFNEENQKKN